MLRVTNHDVDRTGGLLAAISDVSATALRELAEAHTRQLEADRVSNIARLIVHKAPHLDEYLAELLFRSALPTNVRTEFLEAVVYSTEDRLAEDLWPSAAVFGIGHNIAAGSRALFLFDEHVPQGETRLDPSCTELVVKLCFTSLPPALDTIVAEVNQIDSRGGADSLHLNNLLKTAHLTLYELGMAGSVRRTTKLTAAWKRAVVSALVTSVVLAIRSNDLDRVREQGAKRARRQLDRFATSTTYRTHAHFEAVVQKLRSGIGKPSGQILTLPILASAAEEVWGEEMAFFLTSHLWESEILKDIHFRQVRELLDAHCIASDVGNRRLRVPSRIDLPDFAVLVLPVKGRRFKSVSVGQQNRPGSILRDLVIISCRHGSIPLQPNKAIGQFLSELHDGVGVMLIHNTAESNKVIFRGRGLRREYWSALVEEIQRREAGLWMTPAPTADFVINGNQAHREHPLSALTPSRLADICERVHV